MLKSFQHIYLNLKIKYNVHCHLNDNTQVINTQTKYKPGVNTPLIWFGHIHYLNNQYINNQHKCILAQ